MYDRKVQFRELEGTMYSAPIDLSSDTCHDAFNEQPTCHPTQNDCAILANMTKLH